MTLMYCLYCFVLVPLCNMYANNIQYMDTVLPTVIEYIYDLVEIIAIALAYAVSVYSIYRYGVSKIAAPAIIFSSVTFFKYVSNLIMTWKDIGFGTDDLWSDIRSILIPLLLELLQYFVVLLIAYKTLSGHLDFINGKRKAEKRLGRETGGDGIYPFKSLFDLTNPMLKCALWAGVIVAVTKVAQRILYDVLYTVMFGLPRLAEIPVMIVYYVSDIVFGAACYFAMVLILMLLLEKKLKRELYE